MATKRRRGRATRAAAKTRARPHAASELPSFGRTPQSPARLTDLGCPECSGVLLVDHSETDFLTLRCRVGHAYALETLLPMKEDALERALWTAIELSEEIAALGTELAARSPKTSRGVDGETRRSALARKHIGRLREIVATAGPVPPAKERA